MKILLTKKNVATLGNGEYRDLEVPKFVLRVRDASRTYGLKYKRHGETIRVPLGAIDEVTLQDARQSARTLLAKVYVGIDPRDELRRQENDGVLVEDLVRAYIDDAIADGARPSTVVNYENILKSDFTPLRKVAAVRVTTKMVVELLDDIRPKANTPKRPDGKRPRSGYVANRAYDLLRATFARAVKRHTLAVSPMADLTRPFKERQNERYLSIDEVRAFLQAYDSLQDDAYRKKRRGGRRAGDGRATCAMLLALTGLRVHAVEGARADEFDALDSETEAAWRVPAIRMKSKRDYLAPLSRQAAQVVKRRIEEVDGGPILFPARRVEKYEPMEWTSAWVRKMKNRLDQYLGRKAERWRIHDLRTTLSTHMTDQLGVAPHVIDKILDHIGDGPSVRRVYNKGQLVVARREALQAYADWMDSLRRSTMRQASGTPWGPR
jgi:integrase